MSTYSGYAASARSQEMRYMYDMYGRPLLDVQGRPLMYGQPRAPTPQLGGEEVTSKKKEPPRRTSFKGRKVSPLGWATLICAALAFIWSILSFGIPLWATTVERDISYGDQKVGYGLWHYCSRSIKEDSWERCTPINEMPDYNRVPGWFRGCKSMATMALAASICSLVLTALYIFHIKCNREVMPISVTCLSSIIAALLQTGLVIMFGVLFLKNVWWERNMQNYGLSWCFGIGIAAAVFDFTTAVVAAFELYDINS